MIFWLLERGDEGGKEGYSIENYLFFPVLKKGTQWEWELLCHIPFHSYE